MRYFLELAYNGAPYHGWQSQPNAVTVQGEIEKALSVILRKPTTIVGAGRTDTGVNARVMFAHFDAPEIADSKKFLLGLNRLCGPSVAFRNIYEMPEDAHARFDATSRTYKYFVTFDKSPFLDGVSWHAPHGLDIESMNDAAELLIETRDFTSFAKLHASSATNICDVRKAVWEPWKNTVGVPGAVFTITADRFLRNMVRAVVGTLVDVGRGKLDKAGFARIIDRQDRCAAGTSMPPQALFLWDITYNHVLKCK